MPYLVYKITNTVNRKIYVGCTTGSIETRWRGHLSSHRHVNQWTRTDLYDAMTEYGIDKFSIEQLEACPDKETMRNRERYWIRELSSTIPNGYNMKVRILTDEQVAIIRFNTRGLTLRGYAALFGVSWQLVQIAKTGKGSLYTSDPHGYITRDHLPQEETQRQNILIQQARC